MNPPVPARPDVREARSAELVAEYTEIRVAIARGIPSTRERRERLGEVVAELRARSLLD